MYQSSSTKNIFNIGPMTIDFKQVFWKTKSCFAIIPIVQLLEGHILLTTKRQVQSYSQLQPVQVFDLILTAKFLCRALQTYHNVNSTTVYIQNNLKDSPLKQMIMHIVPRKAGDLPSNDSIYEQFQTYPKDLVTYYNQKIGYAINPYINKIFQGIFEQTKKYEAYLDVAFKQQKQN